MTPDEQIQFVRELSENVVNEIVRDIEAGKTPDNWDGHELRRLLAHRFKLAVIGQMGRSRLIAYNNTVLVNDL